VDNTLPKDHGFPLPSPPSIQIVPSFRVKGLASLGGFEYPLDDDILL